ncbi:alpha-glucosidase C-terminal domain-containing protein [Salegentibacter sp. BLCTC]|uniref:alpha-glucosidase C-terminal domain-containing protein n=1 Tax=Salegentibacter sp. BLCTC TaxID=2697368 RepID=UPI00351C371C
MVFFNNHKPFSLKKNKTSEEEKALAFKREKDGAKLIFIANMSKKNINFNIQLDGIFKNYFSGETFTISKEKDMKLEAWEYLILINK